MAKFNTMASLQDTEVRGLTWGQYLEDSPTAQLELARGMVRERLRRSDSKSKKRKGKDVAGIPEVPIWPGVGHKKAALETQSRITNFYTGAKLNEHSPRAEQTEVLQSRQNTGRQRAGRTQSESRPNGSPTESAERGAPEN